MTVPATAWRAGMRITAERLLARNDQQRIEQVAFTAQSSYQQSVTFDEPFPTIPSVQVEIMSGAGVTAGFEARPISVSTTGFTIFIRRSDGTTTTATWDAQPVSWHASV